MPWRPFDFRGDEVWVRVLEGGKPIVRRGLVEFRYKRGARKSYRTQPENIEETEGEVVSDADFSGDETPKTNATALREEPSSPPDADTIVVYTDGACSGNPGPAGIGVHLERPGKLTEISEYMGEATNNAAELRAIFRALEELSEDERKAAIHLYTDSAWCLGVLVGGWKYKTNLKAIEEIKALIEQCPKLELLKVRGHAGIAGNEQADYLATRAVRRETSETKHRARR